MTTDPDPWSLPGLGRWLDDLARRLDHGIAVLPSDPSRPPGVEAALRAHLRHPPVEFRADSGQSPAAAVADAFGTAPTLEALLNPVLDEELGIVVKAPCLAPLSFASHSYDRFHLLMPLFVCRRWEGSPVSREGQGLKWVRPVNMRDYPMPPADEPLIPALIDLL